MSELGWTMKALTTKRPDPVLTDAEATRARELARALVEQKPGHGKVQLRVEKTTVDVPELAVPLIAELLEKMGAGDRVSVQTVHDTLSTTEAAEILNVSRPYVVKLLDQGLIPFVATEGNHRRIQRADLLEFKRRKEAERRKLMDELAAEGQRLSREHKLEQ
jgi:excisionase family DNA binding protein